MTFKERVEERRADLNKSDNAIVDVLLSNPAEAALWRGEDVAARARVHPSAVTRTSKKLGYKGFLELRADLREMHKDFLAGTADQPVDAIEVVNDGTILGNLVAGELKNIQSIPGSIRQRDLDDAVELMVAAKTVFYFGQGMATHLADQMDRRFRAYGFSSINLAGMSAHELAEHVVTMQANDVLVVYAFRKASKQLRQLLSHASDTNCRVIVITDNLQILSPIPNVVLASTRGAKDEFNSMLVPLLISDALALTLEGRYADRARPAIEKLDTLYRHFDA